MPITPTLTPQEFVARWRKVALTERASYQQHFFDLCALIGHPTPIEADPTGEWFAIEAGATKLKGGQGWADVWKKGFFGWEYKGKHANLDKAYQQLLQYRESLVNPPLLVVSDTDRIVVHTNFTNTVKQVYTITLDELLTTSGQKRLRDIFFEPDAFRAPQTTAEVTEQVARDFARLAEQLRKWEGTDALAAHRVAQFLIRLLFCLFAEDIGLLPNQLFSRLIERTRTRPKQFSDYLGQLFAAMATGGDALLEEIPYFNGKLFDDATVLELDSDALDILARVSKNDWSSIEPAILGTLFERSLDPSKRAQLGAHYTSREDILLIVEPVLMAPLRRRWIALQEQARALAQQRDALPDSLDRAIQRRRTAITGEISALLRGFDDEISAVRVLDPACGSGNFLYVALKQLLDLEKEVITFAGDLVVGTFTPNVSPEQLRGIEVNEYAHELAQVTVWIGYIQWLRDNGFGQPSQPILKPLDTIKNMDAILAFDANGTPYEPEWPEADVIVGNPPFLGGKRLRSELGDKTVDTLFTLYDGRVPREADFVTYWFERARALIEQGKVKRAGLLATNSIRGGANRKVLERIKQSGDIFMAWADRSWILEGAAVRVSMVGFDDGKDSLRELEGVPATAINPDLTGTVNITIAKQLHENVGIAFMGDTKVGPFDIDNDTAERMLRAPINPNGRRNNDVVVPWVNGLDITRRPRNMWIIDFGIDTTEENASLYQIPFEYVRLYVKPQRNKSGKGWYRDQWWIHYAPRPAMRIALKGLERFIATPTVAKYRLFDWLKPPTLPDHQLIVIARSDDYFFGVLHSKLHELWSLRMGTFLGVGNDPRYTPTTTFETFAFPWRPGAEPLGDPRVTAIGDAARRLVELRDTWLNPPDADQTELKKRTLTNLYNARPAWLAMAHQRLDAAVFAAYGWPPDLTDEQVLERLLALNMERHAGKG